METANLKIRGYYLACEKPHSLVQSKVPFTVFRKATDNVRDMESKINERSIDHFIYPLLFTANQSRPTSPTTREHRDQIFGPEPGQLRNQAMLISSTMCKKGKI
jgi:hypothetical protein